MQIGGQILTNKTNLKVLLLEWEEQLFEDSRTEDIEMHVIDKLKPPSSLTKLTIKRYGGQSFPSWFKDPASVSNLVVLKLENCAKCQSLPSLEMLSSLKDLTIEGMASLKRIDFQTPLKSLEVLRFKNLREWEHWDTWRGKEDVERLAQLRELCIEECPKLTGEFLDHLPSLERFVIQECSKLVVSVSSLPEECEVGIDYDCKGVVCNGSSINFERLKYSPGTSNISEVESKLKQGSQRVETLAINGSDEILDSWQNLPNIERSSTLGGMHGLTFLKKLELWNCKNDFVFFENTNFLPNLSDLWLHECQTLVSLPIGLKLKNLKTLIIWECNSLRSIDCSMLPSSLKALRIYNCEKLEILMDLSTSFLEELRIDGCHSLTCTSPRQLPDTLQEIYIFYCYELKTLSRCQYLPKALTFLFIKWCGELKSIDGSFEGSTCLKSVNLVDCENLESIPLGLQNLSCVDSLMIEGCPKLLVREGVPTSLIRLKLGGDATSILQEDKGMLTSLTALSIRECPRIESIPNLSSLTSLTEFVIWNCPRIESIPNLSSLTSLAEFVIQNCPTIESIPNLTNLTSLRRLAIQDCSKLKSIPLGNLEQLEIRGCPKLKSLQSLPSSLLSLQVEDCPLLTKQWSKGKKRYCSKIAHIPKVRIDSKLIFNSKEE
ncbi:disease resistance protein RGA2-like [Pistacia vera]|uniref:disease resistance protein RGA2-like n=1 Tax=Pistacia vera TaxID=55513 RepID=UPI001262C036|nr:disease resistance protein RGA2-like [Pistacia vera]